MSNKPSKVPVIQFTRQELSAATLKRLERLAKSRRVSVDAVIEEMIVAELPTLEALYGITPDAPAKAKASSHAKPRVKSPKR